MIGLEPIDGIDDSTAAFLTEYAAAWASPTAERLAGFWVTDGELMQAGMTVPVRGRDAIHAFQTEILRMLPDLTARPVAAAKNGDTLFVHYRCAATVAGQPLVWDGFDRFELDGALARRGLCIFDTAPLRTALLPDDAA